MSSQGVRRSSSWGGSSSVASSKKEVFVSKRELDIARLCRVGITLCAKTAANVK